MATHDYIIDNQSASAFRADLNGALQAVVTQNSKATAPSTTYANMIWYDTTNHQLKKRNEADSAWLVLGTVDEGAGTFTPTGGPATQDQTVWNTGTDTTESVITPAKLNSKIENKLNVSGSAPMYACRAWVNFNGTGTVAIRASGNVSSITDNGTGTYTVNFATAMPDADYVALTTSTGQGGDVLSIAGSGNFGSATLKSTTQLQLVASVGGGTLTDTAEANVAIFR